MVVKGAKVEIEAPVLRDFEATSPPPIYTSF
jgi:hypothetical protein